MAIAIPRCRNRKGSTDVCTHNRIPISKTVHIDKKKVYFCGMWCLFMAVLYSEKKVFTQLTGQT